MKFIELFAGIGGFRYGLERVQFENKNIQKSTTKIRDKERQCEQRNFRNTERLYDCVWANEIDKYACQIYRKNFGEGELYEGDITKVKANDIPNHDLLTAGFPCQSFSIAGKRRGFNDTRGTLFFEIARVCRAKKPRYILLENVKGLFSHQSGQTFKTIIKILSDIGYILQWELLNSKNFGVPQNRERVFIIGHLRGTSRSKVFPIGEGYEKDIQNTKKSQRKESAWALRSRDYKDGTNFIKVMGALTEAYGTRQGSSKEYKSMVNKINKSIGQIRRLTPTECERLQGFPDGWTKGVSDTQRYKCLGNAVTTNVITEIGKRL